MTDWCAQAIPGSSSGYDDKTLDLAGSDSFLSLDFYQLNNSCKVIGDYL